MICIATSKKCLEVDLNSTQLQAELIEGLTQEICKTIEKYEGAIHASTVLGVLDTVKHIILLETVKEHDE
jgi:hypothetical protein